MQVKNAWLKLRVGISQFFIKNYVLITIGTVILVIVLSVYLLLLPKYRLYTLQKDVELVALENNLTKEKSRLEKLQNTQLEFEKFADNENIQKLSQVLPTKKEVADLFIQFESLTKKANFTLLNLSVSEDLSVQSSSANNKSARNQADQTMQDVKSLRVQINVSGGGYNSLKGFLDLLETHVRLFDINSLTFTPNIIGQTNYNLVITTYYIDK